MKSIIGNISLFILFAGLSSCEKDKISIVDQTSGSQPEYHISFYDHKSGKKITSLEGTLMTIANDWFNDFKFPDIELRSDADGDLSFSHPNQSSFNQYIQITNQTYVKALYGFSDTANVNNKNVHSQEGSNGPNVVYAKFVKQINNDFYFRADLYLKVIVDIQFIQVTDYSDSLMLNFNAAVTGTDPLNTGNYFGTSDIFTEGIKLTPGKKIDTTIRVYCFGDYLNKISWNVYENAIVNGFDDWSKRIISIGASDEKFFPSDVPAKITITF